MCALWCLESTEELWCAVLCVRVVYSWLVLCVCIGCSVVCVMCGFQKLLHVFVLVNIKNVQHNSENYLKNEKNPQKMWREKNVFSLLP